METGLTTDFLSFCSFRPATGADADALAVLHGLCFGDSGWRADQIASSLSLSTTISFIALRDGAPLGFLLIQAVENDAEILTLCVAPTARRRGLAAHLLRKGFEVLRHRACSRLFLDVAADNASALKLYSSLGFQALRVRPGYYLRDSVPVDALILELSLIPDDP